jgi:hypothetical protein
MTTYVFPLPPKEQSVHTKDLPDWAYLKAHKTLAEDGEPCPHPEIVGRVGKALLTSTPIVVPDELDMLLSDIDNPTERKAARLQALLNFEAAFGRDATLLDGCLTLRMSDWGATEPPLPDDRRKAMITALRERLATWEERSTPIRSKFDDLVRQLVVATLEEIQALALSRKESGGWSPGCWPEPE